MEKFSLITEKIFKPSEIDLLLDDFKFIKNNKKIEYANIPVAFDIETTSFYDTNNEKCAIMYAWVFGINGKCIIGRTWDEFKLILQKIHTYYNLNDKRRFMIFIHNLSFEFAFLQKQFEWDDVFCVDSRKPVYALCNGFEFRCSYILSGYSLAMVGKNLTTYKVEKKNGDLDYEKLRHNKTPLTEKEYGYIQYDGLVVMAYIQELIEKYGDLHKIPLTNTGFVRKYTRCECLYGGETSHKKYSTIKAYNKYHSLIETLQIPSYKCYLQMKQTFQGGFTHCNSLYEGVEIENVASFDFTSSYPAVMIMEKFPMSTPKLIKLKNLDEFKSYIKTHCCMFNITFYDLKASVTFEHYISESKCFEISSDAVIDNGRVVTASKVSMAITEIDYNIIKDFYNFSKMDIWNFRIMEKSYLPTPFVNAILKLYEDKTTLKGIDDIETLIRYLHSKGMLNSCYGMTVTDIVQIQHKFVNGMWVDEMPDIEETFKKYNNSKSRFLFYPWGIWVTAYARRNLFYAIKFIGKDYLYADTDSIKIRNYEKYLNWINKYNHMVDLKLEKACKWHKFDFSKVSPKTIKGVNKTIGYWDFEGVYKKFKTLGAKRYLVLDENNELSLTCAGVSKKAINYMLKKSKNNIDNVFKMFDNNLYIPKCETGKQIHTYIDEEREGMLTDYLGNKNYYHELSCVHLEAADYSLSLSKKYVDYLIGIQEWIR